MAINSGGLYTAGEKGMELTIDQVRAWLVENKDTPEVKEFFAEISPPPELSAQQVQDFLRTSEGQALIQPIADRRVSDALKTYKENHYEQEVKQAVAQELLKLNPQETPEQKTIRELSETVAAERKARERDNLRRQMVETAAQQGVPSWWVDSFSGNTIDEAKVYIQRLKDYEAEVAKKAKNELINSGYKPKSGDEAPGKRDLSNLTFDEAVKLEMEGKLDDALAG